MKKIPAKSKWLNVFLSFLCISVGVLLSFVDLECEAQKQKSMQL